MNDDFDKWMQRVDNILMMTYSMLSEDLTDYTWADAHEDGLTPKEAVADFTEYWIDAED